MVRDAGSKPCDKPWDTNTIVSNFLSIHHGIDMSFDWYIILKYNEILMYLINTICSIFQTLIINNYMGETLMCWYDNMFMSNSY